MLWSTFKEKNNHGFNRLFDGKKPDMAGTTTIGGRWYGELPQVGRVGWISG